MLTFLNSLFVMFLAVSGCFIDIFIKPYFYLQPTFSFRVANQFNENVRDIMD